MQRYKILMLTGQDRPGIVDGISTLLEQNGACIEDSRMAALGWLLFNHGAVFVSP